MTFAERARPGHVSGIPRDRFSAVTIAATRCPASGCGEDPSKVSLTGIYLGQVIAAAFGVLAIGAEYGTGMIRVSLTAVPRRLELLAAKTLVLAGPGTLASALAVGACRRRAHPRRARLAPARCLNAEEVRVPHLSPASLNR